MTFVAFVLIKYDMKCCWTKIFLQKIFKLRNQHIHRHSNHLNTGQNYLFYGLKGPVKERKKCPKCLDFGCSVFRW